MAKQTIEGYAVVRRAFGRKTFEVCGIGQDTPAAWRDAAETHEGGRFDGVEMIARHPEMKTVKAKITLTFLKPEVAA